MVEINSQNWDQGPFGSPDASRANSDDVYIPIEGASPDISRTQRRLYERIIIGKKGAGKTLYIRTLMQHLGVYEHPNRNSEASQHEGLFVFRETNKLSTAIVLKLTHTFNRAHAHLISRNISVDQEGRSVELWSQIWHCAIIASAYSLVFGRTKNPAFAAVEERAHSDSASSEKLKYVSGFLSDLPPTHSPSSIIKFFAHSKSKNTGQLGSYLDAPEWDTVYELLNTNINAGPQTAIFIDAIDDDFDRAPNAWLNCQEGLFRCVFDFLNRSDPFSNRIHTIVALREIVYSSLLKSEHANRFLQDDRLRYICWDYGPARTLFFRKIQNLPAKYVHDRDFTYDDHGPMQYWLGFDRIKNEKRGIIEPLADYILRHTRLLPRDIVIMGNVISNERTRYISNNVLYKEQQLRESVHEVSKLICNEAIRSSINEHITSMDYVAEALLDSRERGRLFRNDPVANRPIRELSQSDIDLVVDQIKASVLSKVEMFFSLVGTEVFSEEKLHEALVESELVQEYDLYSSERDSFFRFDNILYRHGLIAYQTIQSGHRRWRFSWRGIPVVENSQLPGGQVRYGFHSCVLDAFKNIEAMGDEPVY